MKLKNKSKSFQILLGIVMIALFSSCRSISYQNAVHTNEDRFYGEDEKEALLLVNFKDLSQHAEDLSGIAQDKVYSKDLYDFAVDAERDHRKFQFSLELLALKKRIKLPDAVSEANQKKYREVRDISDKKTFDIRYMNEMKGILTSLTDSSDNYLAEGKDRQIRNFITKHTGVFESEIKRINSLQAYEEKTKKEVSMTK